MPSPEISKGIIATLHYQLRNAKTGQLLGSYDEQDLLFGYGLLLDGFEKNLLGRMAGEEFSFELCSTEAYGDVNQRAIVFVPIDNFVDESGNLELEALKVGNIFPMADSKGDRYFGKIIEVQSDKVKMDFNHHLAGIDLLFTGKVVATRAATTEEVYAILQTKM
jgi:FKBP-type peptidyl-prolyl cis-trans isomerase SlyD